MSQSGVSIEVTHCWPHLPGPEISGCRVLSSFSLRKLQGKHGPQKDSQGSANARIGGIFRKENKKIEPFI